MLGNYFRFFYILIFVIAIALPCVATTPKLQNTPKDTVTLGNAYVDAWRTVRLDFDTLHHGNAHPAMIHQWLDNASIGLLTDIVHHALNPIVVLWAGQRLAHQKNQPAAFFKELAENWKHSPLRVQFAALRVVAGDTKYTSQLKTQLRAKSTFIHISAAEILAQAKQPEGVSALRSHIAKCGPMVAVAAQRIARMGNASDRKIIETAISAKCQPSVLSAASGEILFREQYPLYYDVMLRRDTNEARYQTDHGMYNAWFQILRFSHQNNIHTISEVKGFISRFKQFSTLWPHQEAQVAKRNLDVLTGFLGVISQRIKTKSNTIQWPATFTDALNALQNQTATGFEARVTSAIALINETTPRLQIDQLRHGNQFTVLTPRGSRVIDRNWHTSWYGVANDRLTLEWRTPTNVETLWIATGCLQQEGATLQNIRITTSGKTFTETTHFEFSSKSKFYQPIGVDKKAVQKIQIQLTKTSSSLPVCIAEIRTTQP